ncbi:MAG: hypothetical protein WCE75_15550 [Terracidiphilus sp.]
MTKRIRIRNFQQTLEILREQGFNVEPASAPGAMQVSKYGAAAVLVAGATVDEAAAFLVGPGALVGGEVGRLLDRGYQKFVQTSKFELPATATQLEAIHLFSEELKQLSGAVNLYNEGLGTTSDLYQYDRLRGRAEAEAPAARPWEHAGSH